MIWITIGIGLGGVGLGLLIYDVIDKYKATIYRLQCLEDTCNNLPTVEELAAKAITTKLPINKLPPEVIEAFRQESLKQGPKSLPKNNYIG